MGSSTDGVGAGGPRGAAGGRARPEKRRGRGAGPAGVRAARPGEGPAGGTARPGARAAGGAAGGRAGRGHGAAGGRARRQRAALAGGRAGRGHGARAAGRVGSEGKAAHDNVHEIF